MYSVVLVSGVQLLGIMVHVFRYSSQTLSTLFV